MHRIHVIVCVFQKMDCQVSDLTGEIIDLCTKRLTCKQTIAFDGHIVITVDSYQLLFLDIKHTHQKEHSKVTSKSASSSSHVPPKKKLLQNQKFFGWGESSEDDVDHHRSASSQTENNEQVNDITVEKVMSSTEEKKKFKGDEKAKRHWKKGRKKAFTDAEASKKNENTSKTQKEYPSGLEEAVHVS